MKKPYKFHEVDPNITCPKCGRPLKKNVLARITEKVWLCFKCWIIREYNKGHVVNARLLKSAGIEHTFKDNS